MAVAVISLTNCQKDAPEIAGDSFRIVANLDATRTSNGDLRTLWAENDAVNVFHAVTGTTNYVSDGKFTVSEGAGTSSATFDGVISSDVMSAIASGAALDWYALYPYGADVKTPAATDAGYVSVGDKNGTYTQAVYGDMSHVSGANCPMYGVAKNIKGVPAITFKNLTSVIEFNVVNNTGGVLVVEGVRLEASEDITGTYFIDFTGETPAYTYGEAAHVNSTASVSVETPAGLAPGESAKIYMPIKPYTQDASESFKVTVSGSVDGVSGETVVELNPKGAQAVFTAGKIKPVTIPVNASSAITYELEVSPAEATVEMNSTCNFTATLHTLTNGNRTDSKDVTASCVWSSSDDAVLQSDGQGAFTAKVPGLETVTATYTTSDGKTISATAEVTITVDFGGKSEVTYEYKLSISPAGAQCPMGGTLQFSAILTTVTLENGEQKGTEESDVTASCVWSSSDDTVLKSEGQGTFSGIVPGLETVTATYAVSDDKTVSASTEVTVTVDFGGKAETTYEYKLTVSPADAQCPMGGVLQLTATLTTITLEDGIQKGTEDSDVTSDAIWESLDTDILTSEGKGIIKGVLPGTVTVKATYNLPDGKSISAETEVTVYVDFGGVPET